MRKSRTTFRLLASTGITAAACAAAVVVAPGAAFAAPIASLTPTTGPGGTTVTATSTAFTGTNGTIGVVLTTATTCPTNYLTTPPANGSAAAGQNGQRVNATTVTFTVPTSGLTLVSNAPRAFTPCFYTNSTATGALLHDATGNAQFTLVPTANATPTSGPSGGGTTVTITAPTGVTLPSTVGGIYTLSSNSCPATYSSGGNITTTVNRVSNTSATTSVPSGVTGNNPGTTAYVLCLYADATNGALIATTGNFSVSLPTITPSTTNLAATTQNNFTAQSTVNFLSSSTSPAVAFAPTASASTAPVCPTTYTAAGSATGVVLASNVRKLAENRLSVSVSGLSAASTPYVMCVYDDATTGPVLAAASVTVSTVQAVTGIRPSAGPTLGGSTITITGTNFPATGITATLGGTPLTDIVRLSSTTLTATTPARPAGPASLIVTSGAGSSAPFAGYVYQNAVRVTPNTAPNTATAVNMSVRGVGFLTMDGDFQAGTAAVYLVDGVYNPAPSSYDATEKSNGPVANCGSVLVITDTELICTMRLNRRLDTDGTTLVSTTGAARSLTAISTTNTSTTIESPAGDFTSADVGQAIVETSSTTSIPASTRITAVLSPTRAVISNAATATSAAVAADIGNVPVRTAIAGVVLAGSTATAAAGAFSRADIGREVRGTGITAGTTIVDVSSNGAVATLSAAPTAGTVSVSVFPSPAVPEGAYNVTVVNDSALNAASTNNQFMQTVISTGSTFTVSAF